MRKKRKKHTGMAVKYSDWDRMQKTRTVHALRARESAREKEIERERRGGGVRERERERDKRENACTRARGEGRTYTIISQ